MKQHQIIKKDMILRQHKRKHNILTHLHQPYCQLVGCTHQLDQNVFRKTVQQKIKNKYQQQKTVKTQPTHQLQTLETPQYQPKPKKKFTLHTQVPRSNNLQHPLLFNESKRQKSVQKFIEKQQQMFLQTSNLLGKLQSEKKSTFSGTKKEQKFQLKHIDNFEPPTHTILNRSEQQHLQIDKSTFSKNCSIPQQSPSKLQTKDIFKLLKSKYFKDTIRQHQPDCLKPLQHKAFQKSSSQRWKVRSRSRQLQQITPKHEISVTRQQVGEGLISAWDYDQDY